MLGDVEGTIQLSFAIEEARREPHKFSDFMQKMSGKKMSIASLQSGGESLSPKRIKYQLRHGFMSPAVADGRQDGLKLFDELTKEVKNMKSARNIGSRFPRHNSFAVQPMESRMMNEKSLGRSQGGLGSTVSLGSARTRQQENYKMLFSKPYQVIFIADGQILKDVEEVKSFKIDIS